MSQEDPHLKTKSGLIKLCSNGVPILRADLNMTQNDKQRTTDVINVRSIVETHLSSLALPSFLLQDVYVFNGTTCSVWQLMLLFVCRACF